ncbi:MAG: hypothetical protein KatS3mg051_0970 [Anaerolineae bacterium]|nr:MAG: hypothetical protein KatS3mg051_0970 [Anaerolineae bacterium]
MLTLETANAAANFVSDYAWETKTFRQYDLHRALYYAVENALRCRRKWRCECWRKSLMPTSLTARETTFKPHGSIAYDKRILSWKLSEQTVSIWTVGGRETIPFVAGERQMALLACMQGEADLIYRQGDFYLHQVCEVDEPPPGDVASFWALTWALSTSPLTATARSYSGDVVNNVRHRHRRLRSKLQRKGTKSRAVASSNVAGKERRFATDVNHTISKRIVAAAKDTGRGIALEDLRASANG